MISGIVVLALLGPLHAIAQTPAAAPFNPYVVDSTGQVLGPLVTTGFVAFTLPSKQIIGFAVNPNGFEKRVESVKVYYASIDCTGDPYLIVGTIPERAMLTYFDTTAFIFPSPNPSKMTFGSFKFWGPHGSQVCYKSASTYLASPLNKLTLSSLKAKPPFKLVLQ